MPAPLRSMTEDPSADRVFEIETPSGRRTRTESAASRWLNRSLDWSHMTPEQKLGYVLRLFVGVGVVAVFFSVLFKDQIFGTTPSSDTSSAGAGNAASTSSRSRQAL